MYDKINLHPSYETWITYLVLSWVEIWRPLCIRNSTKVIHKPHDQGAIDFNLSDLRVSWTNFIGWASLHSLNKNTLYRLQYRISFGREEKMSNTTPKSYFGVVCFLNVVILENMKRLNEWTQCCDPCLTFGREKKWTRILKRKIFWK